MKKFIIGVVTVLAVVLIGLKFYSAKQPAPVQVQETAPQVGVSLPAAATASPEVPASGAGLPQQPIGYSGLSFPPMTPLIKGACENGSPKEILDNHGKTWGYAAVKNVGLDLQHSQKIYDYLSSYYACASVVRGDAYLCNMLPAEALSSVSKADSFAAPMNICRQKAVAVLFRAYLAGKISDPAACQMEVGNWDPANLDRVSPIDFCAAAAKGPDSAYQYLNSKVPENAAMERAYLPSSRSSCSGAGSLPCGEFYAIYKALRDGDPGACPRDSRIYCEAFLGKTQAPCTPILEDMSKAYCAYTAEVLKKSNGYIGLTPEQVQATVKQKAVEKAAADKLRKQEEQSEKDVNQHLRKVVGKDEK